MQVPPRSVLAYMKDCFEGSPTLESTKSLIKDLLSRGAQGEEKIAANIAIAFSGDYYKAKESIEKHIPEDKRVTMITRVLAYILRMPLSPVEWSTIRHERCRKFYVAFGEDVRAQTESMAWELQSKDSLLYHLQKAL